MRPFLGLLVALYSFSAFGGERVCVLSFFKKGSKEQAKVEKVFRKHSEILLIQAPAFSETSDCFTGNFDEIVWASHGTLTGATRPYITPVHIDRDSSKSSLFYRRFFDNLAKKLPDHPIHLRVTYCGADDERYPNTMSPLWDEVRAKGGTVEFSPPLRLASKLLGKSVTNLSKSWLSKSLRK
ncbi:MAG TPA: hypothetical protein DCS07_13665 [Bdellovibrionales bacterium]|nr:MAG: hypothetical protein A2Z97_11675 [Bdellovibrionales bacterium GWB1_52_6]OFZ05378.1 MAG: hypothetical protein A2X97_16675 [Bdellovibrionales bacterium GWA1_52_35]OFZ43080.1 MAG: hypothetical protein A2070_01605 [Bdellovibrionales bacterium GWC1_52_8]HAR43656.1 hypothetical protein [Bdellovibrionales bacterium]HCM38978.1 hypothetical protein [Bdellovibrionales bacterium]